LIGTEKGPDLGEEILQLIEAETTYRANAEILRTASNLSRDLLDTLA
jgi:flagellar hook protein FlgE